MSLSLTLLTSKGQLLEIANNKDTETVELYPNNIIEVKVFTITTVKAIK